MLPPAPARPADSAAPVIEPNPKRISSATGFSDGAGHTSLSLLSPSDRSLVTALDSTSASTNLSESDSAAPRPALAWARAFEPALALAAEPGRQQTASTAPLPGAAVDAAAAAAGSEIRRPLWTSPASDFGTAGLEAVLSGGPPSILSRAAWFLDADSPASGPAAVLGASQGAALPGLDFVGQTAQSLVARLALSPVQASYMALTAGSAWWGLRLVGVVAAQGAAAPLWRHVDPLGMLAQQQGAAQRQAALRARTAIT